MPINFLRAVELVLQRVQEVGGHIGTMTSFSDTPRAPRITVAKQAWNETVNNLYQYSGASRPKATGLWKFLLRENQQEYEPPSWVTGVRWPILDLTNNTIITEYPGGYEQLRVDRVAVTSQGQPLMACIEPNRGYLMFDQPPNAGAVGTEIEVLCDRTLMLTNEQDLFPFPDPVVEALVPAVVQVYRKDVQNEMSTSIYMDSMARAARLLRGQPLRTHW